MDDIRRLARPDAQVLEGAITGRALYDGRIDSREAIALLKGVRHERRYRAADPREVPVVDLLARCSLVICRRSLIGADRSRSTYRRRR